MDTSVQPSRHSGQSGPIIDLPLDRMNSAERKVLDAFRTSNGAPLSISDLGIYCFAEQDKELANSSVRNALRRLVRGEWLAKAARGKYKLTASGSSRLLGVTQ